MKNVLLPVSLWLLVAVAFTFRQPIQQMGFPLDPYYLSLYLFPLLLLVSRKISSADLGFKLGKPLAGIFFIFLLPGVLFLRYYFMNLPFSLRTDLPFLFIGTTGEEVFFRGYLQSQFQKIFNSTGLSFFLTNFLFLLIHYIKGYEILPSLMIGIIGLYFSFARDKSGGDSLIYPAGAHFLYDIVSSSAQRI